MTQFRMVWDNQNQRYRTVLMKSYSAELFGDPHVSHLLVDRDEAGNPLYYGYEGLDGSWHIMKTADAVTRYAAGGSDYQSAWTNRASLGYDYPRRLYQGA